MVKMIKDKKEYDIDPSRVEKLLKRGFKLVIEDTPETKDVDNRDREDEIDNE